MSLTVSARLSPQQNDLFRAKLKALDLTHTWTDGPDVDLLYLCGLPASRLLDRYEPIAAAVLPGPRYREKAWYFIDVVGREGESADKRWAFNEETSFSGWLAVQHQFRVEGRSPTEVEWIRTGSHLASLEAVRSGAADRAGIDSMIIDLEPALLEGLAVVSTWGPWPSPPVMADRHLDPELRERLRDVFGSPAGGSWLPLDDGHLAPIIAVASEEHL